MILNFIIASIMSLSLLLTPKSEISGLIYDQNTGEPLTGVKITINEDFTTYTDFSGNFTYPGTSDSLNIKVNYISYESLDLTIIKNDNEYVFNNNGKNDFFY